MSEDLIKKLEQYFATTPREKVLEDWDKSKKWDEVGPTVGEYIKLLESIKVKIKTDGHSKDQTNS